VPEGGELKGAPVIQKVYDLLLWIIPLIGRFPRLHRFLLGDRIEVKLLEILDDLIEAYYTKSKEGLLRAANLRCEQLRVLIRLCRDLGIIGMDKYTTASEKLDEIGRMIGGWKKSLGAR